MDDVAGENGTVIVFICNHCPYVIAVIDRLVADARVLMGEGIGFAAICSNDATAYPEDSFANMKRFAEKHGFPFPYLHDESQKVARAYDAVCTPDFFGLTGTASSSIAAGSTKAEHRRRRPVRAASWSRQCARSPRPDMRRTSKFRRSDVRSNGRPRDNTANPLPRGEGCTPSINTRDWRRG